MQDVSQGILVWQLSCWYRMHLIGFLPHWQDGEAPVLPQLGLNGSSAFLLDISSSIIDTALIAKCETSICTEIQVPPQYSILSR